MPTAEPTKPTPPKARVVPIDHSECGPPQWAGTKWVCPKHPRATVEKPREPYEAPDIESQPSNLIKPPSAAAAFDGATGDVIAETMAMLKHVEDTAADSAALADSERTERDTALGLVLIALQPLSGLVEQLVALANAQSDMLDELKGAVAELKKKKK